MQQTLNKPQCACGASRDLVVRQYKVGSEYRWYWECRDQVACAARSALRDGTVPADERVYERLCQLRRGAA